MKILKTIIAILLAAFSASVVPTADAQELYVGANYHPHDSTPEIWERDIFISNEVNGFLLKPLDQVEANAPGT